MSLVCGRCYPKVHSPISPSECEIEVQNIADLLLVSLRASCKGCHLKLLYAFGCFEENFDPAQPLRSLPSERLFMH